MRAACCEATVLRNEVIAPDIRLLTVVWPDRDHAPHAGQFFTLRAWGADEAPFLSRPISVHRWNPDSSTIEFLYQVVGEGTEKIAQLKMKDTFQLTGPMGNGFDVPDILSKYKKIAVVGGGIAGMIAQLCGAPVWLQVMIAAVVTLVLLLATRPLVKKFLQNKETHTNADRVVGQTAVVTEDIDNLAAHGRVEVLGNDWAARSTENVRIQKGTKVQVVRIEGVKLIVTPTVS